jgi:murein DD-endopeptidase MepM/ murein hydrolase activator NlpD
MKQALSCFTCGTAFVDDEQRLLLVRGRTHEEHCSEACLRQAVAARRKARAATKRRWFLRLCLVSLLALGVNAVRQYRELIRPRTISFEPPAPALHPAAPTRGVTLSGPTLGPPWPPTDDDWAIFFRDPKWIYPLPGPLRRTPTPSAEMLAPRAPRLHPAHCRPSRHCGADLGGELWGEQVYAAHDGVIDRVQRDGTNEPGGTSLRLAHFGGLVYTEYFHLAGIPRELVRGVSVHAGDVIGLVGDTGTGSPTRHLTFALSTQPSLAFSEAFWDPTPWMAEWPLRLPEHGTVAGFAGEKRVEGHSGGGSRRRGEPRAPLSNR